MSSPGWGWRRGRRVDEFTVAGELAVSPINVVRARTVDLLVPAEAEVVIEGLIDTEYLEPEAPFGESHGHGAVRVPAGHPSHGVRRSAQDPGPGPWWRRGRRGGASPRGVYRGRSERMARRVVPGELPPKTLAPSRSSSTGWPSRPSFLYSPMRAGRDAADRKGDRVIPDRTNRAVR